MRAHLNVPPPSGRTFKKRCALAADPSYDWSVVGVFYRQMCRIVCPAHLIEEDSMEQTVLLKGGYVVLPEETFTASIRIKG